MVRIARLLGACALATPSLAAPVAASSPQSYQLVETWQGNGFFDYFDFHSGSDPTHGFVEYVDQHTAENTGMVKINSDGSVYLGVDYTTTLDPSAAGRSSIRINSKKRYDEGLYIADIAHMPGSICGAWPAFWTSGPNWPHGGEIDIIEGVNQEQENSVVIHTGDAAGKCVLSPKDGFTGQMQSQECSEQANPAGCLVRAGPASYGDAFNAAHGGIYAMERTTTSIKIWFFSRAAIPSSIANGSPDTAEFGAPVSALGAACDIEASFQSQQFIFDTTFCGDWAGAIYLMSQCPKSNPQSGSQSCVDFVAKNPAAFQEAYWEINSIKVYQYGASQMSAVPNVPAPPASTAAAVTSASSTTSQRTVSPSSSSVLAFSAMPTPASATPVTTTPATKSSTPLTITLDHATTAHGGSGGQLTSCLHTKTTTLSPFLAPSTTSIQPQVEPSSAAVLSATPSPARSSTLPKITTIVTHLTPLLNSQGVTYTTLSRTETITICPISKVSSTRFQTSIARTSGSHESLTSATPLKNSTNTSTHSSVLAISSGLTYTTLDRTETTTICPLTDTTSASSPTQNSANQSIATISTHPKQGSTATPSASTLRSISIPALGTSAGVGSSQPTISSIPSTTVRPCSSTSAGTIVTASQSPSSEASGSPASSSSPSSPSPSTSSSSLLLHTSGGTTAQAVSTAITGPPSGTGLAGAIFTGAAHKLSMWRSAILGGFAIALLV